jgi:hypothetical protein
MHDRYNIYGKPPALSNQNYIGERKRREIMGTISTRWQMSPPIEALNTPTEGVENGDLHG